MRAASISVPVLVVKDLQVRATGLHEPLLEITGLEIGAGEVVGIIGAPGAGKTILARSIIGLLPPNLAVSCGSIQLQGEDLTTASQVRLDELRGPALAMIFQSPEQALDPLRTCFSQLAEPFRSSGFNRAELLVKFAEDLRKLGFTDPDRVLRSRPGSLSGGERQRVLLAVATARAPELLIADEPTSGLDPALQSGFIDAARARAQAGKATLLISHDETVIERAADRIIFMEAGRLINAQRSQLPRLAPPKSLSERTPLLDVHNLEIRRDRTTVIRNLSFCVDAGQAVGLVGPSGSGKTSLARVLVGLLPPTAGTIALHATRPRQHPQAAQMIYQDPSSSLNPSMTIGDALMEPMLLRGLTEDQAEDELDLLMSMVGMTRELGKRRPDTLSGGQRQLAAIARALAADPALLVLDEPTASLNNAAAAAALQLIRNLVEARRLGVVLISHDIDLVRAFCETVIDLGHCSSRN